MRTRKLERWLPTAVLCVGLFFMAAAVALGQGSPSSGGEVASPPFQQDRNPAGHAHWRGGEGERFRALLARMEPESRCKERFAREAGFLAYIGARLELTAPQQPLWDAYHKAMMDAAGKQRQTCLENVIHPGSPLTALERRDRLQKILQARLDGLQSTRPALDALYQALSQEQRQVVDSPFHGRFRGGSEGDR